MSATRRIVRRRWGRRKRARTGARLIVRWLIIIVLIIVGLNLLGLLTGAGTVVAVYAAYAQDLPEPGEIALVEEGFATTRIYDRSGTVLLYEIIDPLGGDRSWVELDDIPMDLRNATIAIEDQSFYENPGYDLEGILRAVWNNLLGRPVQGGSSITQQLVKNVLIAPELRGEVSFERKIQELILAIRISQLYSKDQILEWYLNTNFYGNLAYGVEAAAQVYFGRSVSELTLGESAMLAAIPQSPGLNPIDAPEEARERQQVVLDAMVEQGYITQAEADEAATQELDIQLAEQRFDLLAPHFSIAVRKELEDMFGPDMVYRGGLTVYTTLDYDLYLQTECAARTHIARLSGQPPTTVIPAADGSECVAADYLPPLAPGDEYVDHAATNAGVVVINARTGEVLSMMGSLDYYNEAIAGNFNVVDALRQPGSAFKPFTYVTAFEQGYTPATMLLDVRTAFDVGSNQPYVPENIDRQFHGPQSVRSALANSYNIPAVQMLEMVGIDSTIRTAHAMGINSLDEDISHYGLSLTLGGGETTLYDTTYAYSVLATLGQMNGTPVPADERRPGYRTLDPSLILRVEDRDGNILWQYGEGTTFSSVSVLEPELAYLVTDILSDDVARQPSVGADSALLLDRPAAAKTGTTNDYRDSLTIGYTPQIATGVWVGNSDYSPMNGVSGIIGAAPIWHAVMEYAHRDLPVETWPRPSGVVEMTVCQTSGLLPTEYCPTRQEIFRTGTEPTRYDNVYQPFMVNRETGLLATAYTPPDQAEERIYMILPPEAADWVRESGIEQPPTEYDTLHTPSIFGNVAIITPEPYGYVSGVVEITGNATDEDFQLYRLDYGEGLNPTRWLQIGQTHSEPRYNTLLETWDVRTMDGLYSLRLTLLRGDQTFQEFVTQVTVDNVAPRVQLLYPHDGQQYTLDDEFVTIQPLAEDNLSMARVEFYVDNALIATSTIPPFNERWMIATPGRHVIYVTAFDSAGNSTISNRISVTVEED